MSAICATLVYVITWIKLNMFLIFIISGIMLTLTCYLIFALPIQLLLNRNSKRFSFKYLLIYIVSSFVAWLSMAVLFESYNPIGNLLARYEIYLFSVLFALIF
ncbi:UPF0715 family protein [Bacillus atrophaeus]|uniref:UPF0715 family protein n=1 Tax=Bacillus atrophaeus TaxID=1452 RepID=UPI003F5A9B16